MDFYQKSNQIYFQVPEFIREKKAFVLATVTSTQGSAPQKPGCSAIYGENGLLAGTVGGGVVELAVGEIAAKAIRQKKSGYYIYDLDNDISDLEAAICGGGMSILIDGNPEKHLAVFELLSQSLLDHKPGVLASFCDSEVSKCGDLKRVWITKENISTFSGELSEGILTSVAEMLDNENPDEFREIEISGTLNDDLRLVFLESVVPPFQLIIAGAGHVGKALSHLAKLVNFEVVVWDDRPELSVKPNLPDADQILSGELEECLGALSVNEKTFIVIVTRGHKNDADVLRLFINSGAGYIGMIGSRSKIAQIRESSIEKGWATREQWTKIYSPIGLEIGSKTVQEIAVSIAAQLIQVRNKLKK